MLPAQDIYRTRTTPPPRITPDVTEPCYLQVIDVDATNGHWIQVKGDARGLSDPDDPWRIHAPPGVDNTTGALHTDLTETGSRYLYGQMRYIPPQVGFDDTGTTRGVQAGNLLSGEYLDDGGTYDPEVGVQFNEGDGPAIQRPDGSGEIPDRDVPDDVYRRLKKEAEARRPKAKPRKPSICGPDISKWFKEEMKLWANFAKKMKKKAEKWGEEATEAQEWIIEPPGADGFNTRSYLLSIVALAALKMTYHPDTDFSAPGCPSGRKCEDTVTLCDHCIHKSEVGNFMYGYFAQKMDIGWLQTWAGSIVGNRGDRTDADAAAVSLGYDFAREGHTDPCLALNGIPGPGTPDFSDDWEDMQSDAHSSCTPCDKSVDASKNHTEFPDTSELEADDEIEIEVPSSVR